MSEKTPLLHYRLSEASCSEAPAGVLPVPPSRDRGQSAAGPRRGPASTSQPKKLNTFFGVVVPTLLSMFSVVVFLRIGFMVGQCGLYQAIAMYVVAYFIISMTVLSVCAISTNGALDAGGAYYMISRALGPEFGGSIGIMFFLGNVCASALFVLGLVEAIESTFGMPEDGTLPISPHQVLPSGYWWSLLYGTAVALLCLLVCLVGANIYASATFLIFLVVILSLGTVFVSFFSVRPHNVTLPGSAFLPGNTSSPMASFTGFKLDTLIGNLGEGYGVDYTTGRMMNFATVFAVVFNGCTGIMTGSNISGDLKNPSYSIPRGTITAVIFTFIIYNLLMVMAACTCDRVLLQRDYNYLSDINVWHPFVTVGVYCSTLSAAMSSLIGASRILYALAKDHLFGRVLSPAKRTSCGGNPWVAVLLSWFLVQLVLFAGKVNTIAGISTIFFLLVYAAVDLACLALEWASAPNFRPTFRYFTWHTCLLGIMGCAIMMFLINAIYASASIAFMLLLLLLIHYLSPTSSWGYISQALIFHQVRKYLLMLDVRKDHVKFWRPQVLLMVSNPRTAVGLISFINDIKKSGLYVLGHVQLGELNTLPSDPLQSQYDSWLSLVDHLNIKAFVNLTLATSVRHGVQHLLFISGLGGMRPNTLVLGFYDNNPPEDKLLGLVLSSSGPRDPEDQQQQKPFHFPSLRGDAATGKSMDPQEYVAVIADAIKMLKNVALARYFHDFQRARALSPAEKGAGVYVDVWPVNLLRPDSSSYVDTCSLFLLQLACILNMVRAWRRARLRLFLCVEEGRSLRGTKEKLGQLLKELRIKATVYTVPWDSQVALHWQRQSRAEKRPLDPAQEQPEQEEDNQEEPEVEEEEDEYVNSFPSNGARLSDDYLLAVNRLILDQPCLSPAVRFLYLPRPPADTRRYTTYLRQLDLLTLNLGPTLLIHGVTPVLTTDL
ncbi:solute carrier family 12 member 9 [Gadus macrocephalus]|uniref:solute carrier family 12 member 9 n=1 Tax=Gadus macrocephalus TaxID=80720 RepID=UPI0028CBBD8E|nr:solute carrier family 12 member 9 [Gadus macrocephalus]